MWDILSEKFWPFINDRICKQLLIGNINTKHDKKDQRYCKKYWLGEQRWWGLCSNRFTENWSSLLDYLNAIE